MTELDTTRAPVGLLAASMLVEAVSRYGDLAERHYLELKSTLDLSKKKDKEKIAKFILGAANRSPETAASAFEGYAVMIIGVAEGTISGILPVEMMDIAKIVQQYLGASGPHWDVLWVPIAGSTNQVLVVLVDPPKPGQGPFLCRANGESLTDGRIYIRADGETREAKADEVDLLIQRGNAGARTEVDFAVEVLGDVATIAVNEASTIDEYIARVRQRLLAALPREETSEFGTAAIAGLTASAFGERAAILGGMLEPEKRTEAEYRESIDQWETRFREAWPAALLQVVSSRLVPAIVKITNRTTTFFHDVAAELHLEGNISAYPRHDPDWVNRLEDLKLPKPPRKWGPKERRVTVPDYTRYLAGSAANLATYAPPSISFKNGGSVSLNLQVGELRPKGSYESEDEEIVLILADRSISSVRGTWSLTARDHHEVYTGEIDVSVTGNHDLTEPVRRVLGLRTDTENPDSR